jgi:hypothetical protein
LRISGPKLVAGIVAAAAVLFFAARAMRPGEDNVSLVDQREGRELWTLVRGMEPRGLDAPAREGSTSRIVREPLDVLRAQNFFPIGGNHVYDRFTYFRKRPGMSQSMPMPDYPGGAWLMRTNSQGFREDGELPAERPDVFVLVAGDSHTEGMCSNAESYANRLEAMLRGARPGQSVEVLNTGCASYSVYNYLGALEAFADKEPDVLVTAIFGGNDFVECLPLYHYFHHTQSAPINRYDWDRVSSQLEMGESALAQGLSSASYFSRSPDEVDHALRAAIEVTDEMRRRCDELGTALIVVYIPSVFDFPAGEAASKLAEAKALMKLSDYELLAGDRLGERLVGALRARGTEVIDLREHFDPAKGPWYWSEYHINLRSQQRIAELLLPRVEARLAAR